MLVNNYEILYIILVIFYFPISIFAEEVPAGYVAKWETTLLTEKDYTENK